MTSERERDESHVSDVSDVTRHASRDEHAVEDPDRRVAGGVEARDESALGRTSHGIPAFERSLPMALLRARETVMAHFRPILAEHDLTEQQWRVLRALDASASARSVGSLARETFLLGPSLSRMLVALERRGLIARETSTADGRRSDIVISAAGTELVTEVAPMSEAVYRRIDAAFEDGQLDELYDLLHRIANIE